MNLDIWSKLNDKHLICLLFFLVRFGAFFYIKPFSAQIIHLSGGCVLSLAPEGETWQGECEIEGNGMRSVKDEQVDRTHVP